MLRNIYGFTDSGKKVKVGTYDDGLYPVGGRIFYIDPNSDETVKFYDANGSELSNIDVGSIPAYYKVASAGVSGKDKYYVYREDIYANKVWTYYENGDWVYEDTGFTSKLIGSGKSNTTSIMSLHDGAYVTDDANGYATIWYQIQQCRNSLLGNCSDWFIGTEQELEELKLFINSYISTLGLVDLFTGNQIWSSSEGTYRYSRAHFNSSWGSVFKSSIYSLIPIRSF